jgi:hypothetical protein
LEELYELISPIARRWGISADELLDFVSEFKDSAGVTLNTASFSE